MSGPRRSPPHVLQTTPTAYARDGVIGGGERIAVYVDESIRLAAAALGLPVETTLLALDASQPMGRDTDRYQAIAGRPWDPGSLVAKDLVARIRRSDVVYVHQCLTEIGMFVAAHARLCRKRVLGMDSGGGDTPLLAMTPSTALVYDALHAQSRFATNSFAGLPVPVHVIPGPVDTDAHRPSVGGSGRDPARVLAVGRIIPHKGFERTIRALPRGLSLDIVGQAYDAAYFAFLRQCAEGRDVRFHTDLDDAAVREHMAQAALFVHASTHVDYLGRFSHKPELLGLAPLEALSCGLVTLVSDAGSLAELGRLPGCFVFRSDAELAELLRLASARRLAGSDPEAMHAAVERGYGLRRVGIELLKLMDIAPA